MSDGGATHKFNGARVGQLGMEGSAMTYETTVYGTESRPERDILKSGCV